MRRSLTGAQECLAKVPPKVEDRPLSLLVGLVMRLGLCGPDASELRIFQIAYGDEKTGKEAYDAACLTADDTVVRAYCVAQLKRVVKDMMSKTTNPA